MITIAGLLLSSALAVQALPFNISMSHDEQVWKEILFFKNPNLSIHIYYVLQYI